MLGVEIHESEGPVVPVADGSQHLIVVGAQFLRRRIVVEGITHVHAKTVDTHAIGVQDHLRHFLVRRAAFESAQMAVQVPDHSGSRQHKRFFYTI